MYNIVCGGGGSQPRSYVLSYYFLYSISCADLEGGGGRGGSGLPLDFANLNIADITGKEN